MSSWPKSRLGRTLEFLDNWHHDKKAPGSWIFCDLWEWWVTAGDPDHPRMIVRERLHKLGFGPDPYKRLVRPRRQADESDTTVEEFDAMWEDAVPVETVGPYDWADDDTMSAEETMRRFEALGPDVTVTGPEEHNSQPDGL